MNVLQYHKCEYTSTQLLKHNFHNYLDAKVVKKKVFSAKRDALKRKT